jgi:hypothetical protein
MWREGGRPKPQVLNGSSILYRTARGTAVLAAGHTPLRAERFCVFFLRTNTKIALLFLLFFWPMSLEFCAFAG